MRVDGTVNISLNFEEFIAIYRVLWKVDRKLMNQWELFEREINSVFAIRVALSDWLERGPVPIKPTSSSD